METSRTNAQYKRNDRYNFLYEIEWILSVLWIFFVRQTRQIQPYGNQALVPTSCAVGLSSQRILRVFFYVHVTMVHSVALALAASCFYNSIAVIAAAPTGKASLVYSNVQTRPKGQYNGKWPFSLVHVLKPLITPLRAIDSSEQMPWVRILFPA